MGNLRKVTRLLQPKHWYYLANKPKKWWFSRLNFTLFYIELCVCTINPTLASCWNWSKPVSLFWVTSPGQLWFGCWAVFTLSLSSFTVLSLSSLSPSLSTSLLSSYFVFLPPCLSHLPILTFFLTTLFSPTSLLLFLSPFRSSSYSFCLPPLPLSQSVEGPLI